MEDDEDENDEEAGDEEGRDVKDAAGTEEFDRREEADDESAADADEENDADDESVGDANEVVGPTAELDDEGVTAFETAAGTDVVPRTTEGELGLRLEAALGADDCESCLFGPLCKACAKCALLPFAGLCSSTSTNSATS